MVSLIKHYEELSEADLAQIAVIFRQAFCSEKGEEWSDREILEFTKRGAPEKIFAMVYGDNGELVGYASAFKLIPGVLPEEVSLPDTYYPIGNA